MAKKGVKKATQTTPRSKRVARPLKKARRRVERNTTPPPSDVIKHLGSFLWKGIDRQSYKDLASHWAGVSRTELLAQAPTPELPFHVRYFEIARGGFSTREFHQHEHVVLVVRGEGTVDLAGESYSLTVGDVVRVRSNQIHQFLHRGKSEPFGFYCIVAGKRDRPNVVGGSASACEWPGPGKGKSAAH
jgi:quercetin dioxygenase-like cupin family protein